MGEKDRVATKEGERVISTVNVNREGGFNAKRESENRV